MKLGRNIQICEYRHCSKDSQGHRSKVKVMIRSNVVKKWRRHAFRRRGVTAYLLILLWRMKFTFFNWWNLQRTNTWRQLQRSVKVTDTVHCRSSSYTTPCFITLRQRPITPTTHCCRRRPPFQTPTIRRRRTSVPATTLRRSSSDCSRSDRGWTSSAPHSDRSPHLVLLSTPSSLSEFTKHWSVFRCSLTNLCSVCVITVVNFTVFILQYDKYFTIHLVGRGSRRRGETPKASMG